jgi:NAD(P)H-dependent FMN reductase
MNIRPKLVILSSSIRKGRLSHRAALYFYNYIREKEIANAEIVDLLEYNFPLFNERLIYQHDPSKESLDFSDRIKNCDGVIVITPEYNGGYPASLKNAIDLLTDEWRHKPVAIVTVSDGNFAGVQSITSLQFTFWKMRVLTVPGQFRVPNINSSLNESGIPADKLAMDKRAGPFIRELLWMIEARSRMAP